MRPSSKVRKQTRWVEGNNPTSRKEGEGILYDEPDHEFDHADTTTWPPRFVDLSSFWVYKVVKDANISQAIRFGNWPSTFNSRRGIQQEWKNKGKAPRVFDKKNGTWNYPIIFNSLQLHGEEGETAHLNATDLIVGNPHNKHHITIGNLCISENAEDEALRPLKPLASKKRSMECDGEQNKRLKNDGSSTTDDIVELAPNELQIDIPARKSFSPTQSPFIGPQLFTPAIDPYLEALMKFSGPRKRLRNGKPPSRKKEDTLDRAKTPEHSPVMQGVVSDLNVPDVQETVMESSTVSHSNIAVMQEMVADSNVPEVQEVITDSNVPDVQETVMESSIVSHSNIPDVPETNSLCSRFSDAGSESSSEHEVSLSHKSQLLLRQGVELGRLQEELATAREDNQEYIDDRLQLETKLIVADGKVMMMTAVLHSSFRMLSQLSKGLESCVTLAQTARKGYDKTTEEGQESFEQIKQESAHVVEFTNKVRSSVEKLNKEYDWLRTCFPRSQRITADGQGIQEWCGENAPMGGKAAEKGDRQVDHKGQIVGEMEDETADL